jgi:hypothetical protein
MTIAEIETSAPHFLHVDGDDLQQINMEEW